LRIPHENSLSTRRYGASMVSESKRQRLWFQIPSTVRLTTRFGGAGNALSAGPTPTDPTRSSSRGPLHRYLRREPGFVIKTARSEEHTSELQSRLDLVWR